MSTFNDSRVRHCNDHTTPARGQYVLYWMTMYRRLQHNHALDYALHMARSLGVPLVIFEAVKLNYPWASARFHQFLLEGMADNHAAAAKLRATYWPCVETTEHPTHGLVRKLCEKARLLVTDDYPQFIIPAQIHAVATRVTIPVHAVDGNSFIPLALLGKTVGAAAHLRPRMHKLFTHAWENQASPAPDFDGVALKADAPFLVWQPPADVAAFVAELPIDQSVNAVNGARGGASSGRKLLKQFLAKKLSRYDAERNQPDDPKANSASGLSAHLHYGHLSIQEVIRDTLGPDWSPNELNLKTRNKDDFFCRDANVNGFLDEAITWRDVGFQWHFTRMAEHRALQGTVSTVKPGSQSHYNFSSNDYAPLPNAGTLAGVLPPWALATLVKHQSDQREYEYSFDDFEQAATHDKLWNAAQVELRHTGRIHNYLRMLWGKKVLEWSATPEDAYRTLETLNNKYALDGRDPNSYTGILWCFGLFDRPWPPERAVFGNVRFMSSVNTAKKFDLDGYYEYIQTLTGTPRTQTGQLFED
jgi:deoxyribodipyrimidine photo-lyase